MNWVSESIERSVAETIPVESDWVWPKGLPIAATGCADRELVGVAERDRLDVEALGVDLDQGDVGVGSKPMISAGTWLRSPNST